MLTRVPLTAASAAAYALCFPPREAAALLGGVYALVGAASVSFWVAPTLAGCFGQAPGVTAPLLAPFWLGVASPY